MPVWFRRVAARRSQTIRDGRPPDGNALPVERAAPVAAVEVPQREHPHTREHGLGRLGCALAGPAPRLYRPLRGIETHLEPLGVGFEEIDFVSPLFNFVRLSGEALICPDTHADERFASDPMVNGAAAIRHCAAIPLCTREGYTIGAFCLVGSQPKHLTRRQVELLRSMATIVGELIEAQSEIGLVDAITRLPNRQRLMGELGNLPDTGKYALLLFDTIDIQYAYEMARSFGLSTVELLLGDISHFLKETFLSERMLYSIAPGRFAVIIEAQHMPQAKRDLLRCADRLHHEVRGAVPLRLELNAGYALFSAPHADPPEILRQATSALHDSIDEGRAVSLYSEPKDAARKHNFNIFNELAQSLKENNRGLFLEYQPQIDLASGRIVGARRARPFRVMRCTEPTRTKSAALKPPRTRAAPAGPSPRSSSSPTPQAGTRRPRRRSCAGGPPPPAARSPPPGGQAARACR